MSIMKKLKDNSRLKYTEVLSKSTVLKNKDVIPTSVPMINVALSGSIDGGLTSGLTVIAGPSKHFKTSFALLIASAYMQKYPEAVMLFYDSEFGSGKAYFPVYGIDEERVLHAPIMNIEELKFDLINQLESLDRSDKVIVVIDSVGNLASKKELEDALKENTAADMTRAKQLKSLFRMVTPYLAIKDIPMLAINHTYQTQEMYSKAVVSGGTGIYYSADTIWIVGRQQDKDGTEIKGYHFIINVDKSRFVKEKSKIPISVSWEGGVQKYSGLLDIAVAGNFVHKGKKGRSTGFFKMDPHTGEIDEKAYYEAETHTTEFWKDLLTDPKFKAFVEDMYQIKAKGIEEVVPENLTEKIDD